jgi:hypothetical protein
VKETERRETERRSQMSVERSGQALTGAAAAWRETHITLFLSLSHFSLSTLSLCLFLSASLCSTQFILSLFTTPLFLYPSLSPPLSLSLYHNLTPSLL